MAVINRLIICDENFGVLGWGSREEVEWVGGHKGATHQELKNRNGALDLANYFEMRKNYWSHCEERFPLW